eukprot:5826272-Pyramimonas_sp.AAC.1
MAMWTKIVGRAPELMSGGGTQARPSQEWKSFEQAERVKSTKTSMQELRLQAECMMDGLRSGESGEEERMRGGDESGGQEEEDEGGGG